MRLCVRAFEAPACFEKLSTAITDNSHFTTVSIGVCVRVYVNDCIAYLDTVAPTVEHLVASICLSIDTEPAVAAHAVPTSTTTSTSTGHLPAVLGGEGAQGPVVALPQEVHDLVPEARGAQGKLHLQVQY
jgi:hypothetical protein